MIGQKSLFGDGFSLDENTQKPDTKTCVTPKKKESGTVQLSHAFLLYDDRVQYWFSLFYNSLGEIVLSCQKLEKGTNDAKDLS